MFTPNIQNKKRKSHIKHCKKLPVRKEPPKCKHSKTVRDVEIGSYICLQCHEIVDQIYILKLEGRINVWNRSYDRNRWKDYGIEYLNGKNSDRLTAQVWMAVLKEIPVEFTWYQVFKVFQRCSILEYWLALPNVLKMPCVITTEVMHLVDKYLNICQTKYRITYLFLMYKFVQLLGKEGDERYVPLARSKAWCKKTDEWWKTVAEQEGFKFKPTVIYTNTWDKENILRQMGRTVKLQFNHISVHSKAGKEIVEAVKRKRFVEPVLVKPKKPSVEPVKKKSKIKPLKSYHLYSTFKIYSLWLKECQKLKQSESNPLSSTKAVGLSLLQ